MADDNVPPNPSTPPPSTSDHEVVNGELIDRLRDAKKANIYSTDSCTLFLTEGESAQNFALAGIALLGDDLYGSYPLIGMPMNVSNKSIEVLEQNEEFVNIKDIIGLEYRKEYDDETVNKLRYRHVVLMCDQDHDGSHIRGLLINMFLSRWPSLLRVKQFLRLFVTPLVKASWKNDTQVFYSMSKYDQWRVEMKEAVAKYKIDYKKGLASIRGHEALGYFREFQKYVKDFIWEGEEDGYAIKRSFSNDDSYRKERSMWLREAIEQGRQGNDCLDLKEIRYRDFCDNELMDSLVYGIRRSIPSMVDGLKVSQRKVLYYLFGRLTSNDIKIPSLSTHVVEQTCYHHGEANLDGVIMRMAQDFVGSNNLNLLEPIGEFGSRAEVFFV